jgi:hypothetical protein
VPFPIVAVRGGAASLDWLRLAVLGIVRQVGPAINRQIASRILRGWAQLVCG